MLKEKDIICISTIDWDFNWQGHQEIMSAFAKNGNRVLFIENTGIRRPSFKDIPRLKKRLLNWIKSIKGFREVTPRLYVYSPVILPFPYSDLCRFINTFILLRPLKRWCKILGFHTPVIWTFLPTRVSLDIAREFDYELLVYYCIADFNKLTDNQRGLEKAERDLISKADIIFAQGGELEEKCRKSNDNVFIFPFGVNIKVFQDFMQSATCGIPEDIKDINKPIIGYIGGVHRHIDLKLIIHIALRHPEWSIVLVGPIQTDVSVLGGIKNIFLLGKKNFRSLPAYIAAFDVCLIPYEMQEYTKTVFPTKLNEYNAMGKPVVSTNLPEVVKFNNENDGIVLIGDTYDGIINAISKALDDKDKRLIEKRMAIAKKNDWETRIEEMSSVLEEGINKKAQILISWQESFLRLYRSFRKKVLITGAIVLSSYLLLFHTPLIWFLSEPLKISQSPQRADCIVVFAGGVGESGKVDLGRSYEERLLYATELYKQGFAPFMIFSSGYVYTIREADLMKVLAVSWGIPAENIILEENAASTYENVEFTRDILNRKGWKSLLLVSSPYHMLRTSLVFKKVAPEFKVYYTPIPYSLFFDKSQGIKLRHIKAIVHEYISIFYYLVKGYI